MSRRKRAIERQKKLNSPAKKAKASKRRYYSSFEAIEKWEDKKGRKEQKYLSFKMSKGINKNCSLMGWQYPNEELCRGCRIKECTMKK